MGVKSGGEMEGEMEGKVGLKEEVGVGRVFCWMLRERFV